ncbi:peptidoglycan editing factor PgeF [Acidobacteria bacterium AB60]|nr:peptidoglycan editing factor PgeF [Acidobacteria bacterium AB60]
MPPAPHPPSLPAAPHPAPNGVSLLTVPGWEALPWLWHAFSTRRGGVSVAYAAQESSGELNLGFTADDSRENVVRNRQLLAEAVTGDPATPLVTVRQVHSAVIVTTGPDAPAQPACEGDGLITAQPGILLGIQTADCVPVLVADRRRKAVAAFHAGWRGTVQRIVEHGIARMAREFGSQPQDLVAAIGPAIGPCCYTVGPDLLSAFQAQFDDASSLFHTVGNDLRLDLHEANRRQLLAAGLAPQAIALVGGCTACQPQLFFSHRAAHGRAGRMLSVIGIRPH